MNAQATIILFARCGGSLLLPLYLASNEHSPDSTYGVPNSCRALSSYALAPRALRKSIPCALGIGSNPYPHRLAVKPEISDDHCKEIICARLTTSMIQAPRRPIFFTGGMVEHPPEPG
jgi:hypothetical protein